MTPMAHQNAESAARATVMAVTAENAITILTTTQIQPLVKTNQLKSPRMQVKHKMRRPSRARTLIALPVLHHLLHQLLHRLQILALILLKPANRHKQHLHLYLNQNLQPPAAGLPKVQAFELPIASLIQVAEGSGLKWVNSDPEKIAQVQAAIAAEPKPVHVPRERPPAVVLDEGPLVLVETRKDLSDMKLPF